MRKVLGWLLVSVLAMPAFGQEFEQVNTTSPQTLTNKTLGPSTTLQSPTITGTITGSATITTPTITSPTITGTVAGSASYTSPTITGTVAGSASYTSPTITSPTITGTVGGGASYTGPTLTSPTVTGTVTGGATYTSPILTTPTLTLQSYTKAGLPTAGTAGRLARVTDDVRGLWMDQSVQWFALNGKVVNVQEFGAKGDGAVDDTASVQAAVAVAESAGGVVWFPVGIYRITAEITVRSNVCLMGASMFNAIISNQNGVGGHAIHFTDTTTSQKELRYGCITNMRVTGNASSGDGVVVDNPYHFGARWVYIDQNGGVGLDFKKGIYGSTYGQNIWVQGAWIQTNRKGGIRILGSSSGMDIVTVRESSVNQNAYYGIYADRTSVLTIQSNEFAAYYYGALLAGHQAVPVVLNGGQSVRLLDNSFEENGGNGVTPNYQIRTGYDGDLQANASNTTQALTISGNDFKVISGGAGGAVNHIMLRFAQAVMIGPGNMFEKPGGYANVVNGVEFDASTLTNGGYMFTQNYWHPVDAKLTGSVRPVIWDDIYFDSVTASDVTAHGSRCDTTSQVTLWNRYATDTYDNFRLKCDGSVEMGPGSATPITVLNAGATTLRLNATAFASLGTPSNGTIAYCNDCTVANPCAGAGTGAIAKRLNGAWVCN